MTDDPIETIPDDAREAYEDKATLQDAEDEELLDELVSAVQRGNDEEVRIIREVVRSRMDGAYKPTF